MGPALLSRSATIKPTVKLHVHDIQLSNIWFQNKIIWSCYSHFSTSWNWGAFNRSEVCFILTSRIPSSSWPSFCSPPMGCASFKLLLERQLRLLSEKKQNFATLLLSDVPAAFGTGTWPPARVITEKNSLQLGIHLQIVLEAGVPATYSQKTNNLFFYYIRQIQILLAKELLFFWGGGVGWNHPHPHRATSVAKIWTIETERKEDNHMIIKHK